MKESWEALFSEMHFFHSTNKIQIHVSVETCLVLRWPRLSAPSARGQGSIPGQGTRSHMPQLGYSTAK